MDQDTDEFDARQQSIDTLWCQLTVKVPSALLKQQTTAASHHRRKMIQIPTDPQSQQPRQKIREVNNRQTINKTVKLSHTRLRALGSQSWSQFLGSQPAGDLVNWPLTTLLSPADTQTNRHTDRHTDRQTDRPLTSLSLVDSCHH